MSTGHEESSGSHVPAPWVRVAAHVPRLGEVVDLSIDGERTFEEAIAWHPGSMRLKNGLVSVQLLWWRPHRTKTNDGAGSAAMAKAAAPERRFKVGDEAVVIWIPPPDPDNALLVGLEYLGIGVVVMADEGELLRVQALPFGAVFFASDRMLGPPGTKPLMDPEVEAVGLAIVLALLAPASTELRRPLRLSDVGGDYEQLVRAAAVAAIETLNEARGREAVAAWMMVRGYATGHGDTVHDLLCELVGQLGAQAARVTAAAVRLAGACPHCGSPTGSHNEGCRFFVKLG